MTSLSEFAAQQLPKGWESEITWDGHKGEISTGPMEMEPTPALWNTLIADWGIDPNRVQVKDGTIQVRAWDSNLGSGIVQRFKYYRATLEPRAGVEDRADVDELCALASEKLGIHRLKSYKLAASRSLALLLSDWQIGKGEGGGTAAAIERIKSRLVGFKKHLDNFIALGIKIDNIYIVGLGDLIEQCDGFYPMQTFQVDLDRRSQKKVARRLLLHIIDELVEYDIPIILGAVPGNHGENRKKGKAYTTWTDNDDLALFEEIAEIMAVNTERYGLVAVPTGAISDDLTMTLTISGIPVGFAHGHQFGSQKGAQVRMEEWLRGQVMGNQPIAKAQILFAGHLHHFVASEASGRTVIQVPAMDGGSYWYTNKTGQNSPAGMLAVSIGEACGPRGWSDLVIL